MIRKKSKIPRSHNGAAQQQASERFEWLEKWAGPCLIVRHGRKNQKVHRLHLGEIGDMNLRSSIFDFPNSKSNFIQLLKSKIGDYATLIRFSHTVFALPFDETGFAGVYIGRFQCEPT